MHYLVQSSWSSNDQLDFTLQLKMTEGQGQDLVNQAMYFSNISWPINTQIADAAIGWVGILSACDHHSYIINELEIISNITNWHWYLISKIYLIDALENFILLKVLLILCIYLFKFKLNIELYSRFSGNAMNMEMTSSKYLNLSTIRELNLFVMSSSEMPRQQRSWWTNMVPSWE